MTKHILNNFMRIFFFFIEKKKVSYMLNTSYSPAILLYSTVNNYSIFLEPNMVNICKGFVVVKGNIIMREQDILLPLELLLKFGPEG